MAEVRRSFPGFALGILILSLALVLGSEAAGLRRSGETVFNVKAYGAKGDGRHDDWQAFQKTWIAACHHPWKAKMLIPRGVFLIGPVIFQGPCASPFPLVVQIQGTVLAQTDLSLYMGQEWILFEYINGLILMGGGTLDGQGSEVWKYSDCNVNSNCQMMPMGVKFFRVDNAIIRKLSSVNSKGFHLAINNCNNITLTSLRLIAPADSPNTDGIHLANSNMIVIEKSEIGTGDDCIGMIEGAKNVNITNVRCGPGHGISIGSLGKFPDEEDVMGITVTNCTFTATDNGVRIKTIQGCQPSKASKITFENIVMNGVRNPIIIDQEYNPRGKKLTVPSMVKISDVTFKNIQGTSISQEAINMVCSKAVPCQNIHFENVNLTFTPILGGFKMLDATSTCTNAVGNSFSGTQIPQVACH
ncbi:hypothetical protein MLD38_017979 [Melastoma candidum]|uniref:Uncharacterized protein n=1 Tax=Melastoma candidum TaxID=119954 RepID=A0ACB9QRU8_9MYRT|nr:hypothetical protein MLD38_017979 [Melastoma candidum]